jgi:hypothetical protein
MRINQRDADPDYVEKGRQAFYNDLSTDEYVRFAAYLNPDRPLPVAFDDARGTADRWGRIPRTFVRCTEDHRAGRVAGSDDRGGRRRHAREPVRGPLSGVEPFAVRVDAGQAGRGGVDQRLTVPRGTAVPGNEGPAAPAPWVDRGARAACPSCIVVALPLSPQRPGSASISRAAAADASQSWFWSVWSAQCSVNRVIARTMGSSSPREAAMAMEDVAGRLHGPLALDDPWGARGQAVGGRWRSARPPRRARTRVCASGRSAFRRSARSNACSACAGGRGVTPTPARE